VAGKGGWPVGWGAYLLNYVTKVLIMDLHSMKLPVCKYYLALPAAMRARFSATTALKCCSLSREGMIHVVISHMADLSVYVDTDNALTTDDGDPRLFFTELGL
jgi:hypothetical protein